MPRLPRYILPGYPQHVIQRGNNRSPIFLSEPDYIVYWKMLYSAANRFRCRIHAYVFMTNHVHMIVTPAQDKSLSQAMQSLGRCYVQYFNARYRRTGTLWEGRYKATLIDTDSYLLTCYRYVELNPVRAGMVAHPGEYRWSSYHANACGKPDSLVRPHETYLSLAPAASRRLATYRELFPSCIDGDTLNMIRQATQHGWALGSDQFKSEVEKLAKRRTRPLVQGGDRKSARFKSKGSDSFDPDNSLEFQNIQEIKRV